MDKTKVTYGNPTKALSIYRESLSAALEEIRSLRGENRALQLLLRWTEKDKADCILMAQETR